VGLRGKKGGEVSERKKEKRGCRCYGSCSIRGDRFNKEMEGCDHNKRTIKMRCGEKRTGLCAGEGEKKQFIEEGTLGDREKTLKGTDMSGGRTGVVVEIPGGGGGGG